MTEAQDVPSHTEPRGIKPKRVYVASSWVNDLHVGVCAALRLAGIDFYDYRTADGAQFQWHEIGLDGRVDRRDDFLLAIHSTRANQGFDADFQAMLECDACILVLPSGRSAHLEAGWFIGQGRRTAILAIEDWVRPELMYKMANYIAPSLPALMRWLGG